MMRVEFLGEDGEAAEIEAEGGAASSTWLTIRVRVDGQEFLAQQPHRAGHQGVVRAVRRALDDFYEGMDGGRISDRRGTIHGAWRISTEASDAPVFDGGGVITLPPPAGVGAGDDPDPVGDVDGRWGVHRG